MANVTLRPTDICYYINLFWSVVTLSYKERLEYISSLSSANAEILSDIEGHLINNILKYSTRNSNKIYEFLIPIIRNFIKIRYDEIIKNNLVYVDLYGHIIYKHRDDSDVYKLMNTYKNIDNIPDFEILNNFKIFSKLLKNGLDWYMISLGPKIFSEYLEELNNNNFSNNIINFL